MRKLPVRRARHLLSQFNQQALHTASIIPVRQDGELGGIDAAGDLVHAGQVDSSLKADRRGSVGIGGSTVDFETVDAVLMRGMSRADDGSIPA